MDVSLLLMLCFYQVEVSVTGQTLVQRCPSECGVSVYDLETSIMGGLGPSKVVAPLGGGLEK